MTQILGEYANAAPPGFLMEKGKFAEHSTELTELHGQRIVAHKLWLLGNHRPEVGTGGYAFWRRMRLIPFERVVPNHRKIDNLAVELVRDEGPGILHWLPNPDLRVEPTSTSSCALPDVGGRSRSASRRRRTSAASTSTKSAAMSDG